MPSSRTTSAAGQAVPDVPDLVTLLGAVPAPRARRGVRYPMAQLLAIGLSAVVAGSRSFAAIGEWAAGHAERWRLAAARFGHRMSRRSGACSPGSTPTLWPGSSGRGCGPHRCTGWSAGGRDRRQDGARSTPPRWRSPTPGRRPGPRQRHRPWTARRRGQEQRDPSGTNTAGLLRPGRYGRHRRCRRWHNASQGYPSEPTTLV